MKFTTCWRRTVDLIAAFSSASEIALEDGMNEGKWGGDGCREEVPVRVEQEVISKDRRRSEGNRLHIRLGAVEVHEMQRDEATLDQWKLRLAKR